MPCLSIASITIAASVINKLRRDSVRVRQLEDDLKDRMNRLKESVGATMDDLLDQREQRRRAYEGKLSELAGEAREVETRMQSGMQALESELQRRLAADRERTVRRLEEIRRTVGVEMRGHQEALDSLGEVQEKHREDYSKRIADLTGEMNRHFERERAHRTQLLSEVEGEIASIQVGRRVISEKAVEWMENARIVITGIRELPHARFTPGRLERLCRKFEMIDPVHPDAALALSKEVFLELKELEGNVRMLEHLFEDEYQHALSEVLASIDEVERQAQRTLLVREADGSESGHDVLIDRWSAGSLEKIKSRLLDIRNELVSGASTIPADRVKELVDELKPVPARILAVVDGAVNRVLASQRRVTVADIAADVLQAKGYDCEVIGCYEGEDERGSFVVKCADQSGNAVSVVVNPVGDDGRQMSIEIHSHDVDTHDPRTIAERVEDVRRALLDAEVSVQPFRPSEFTADGGYVDMQAVAEGRRVRRQRRH